jgi:hypothetical protein
MLGPTNMNVFLDCKSKTEEKVLREVLVEIYKN